jgi:hypothetical protein
MKPSYVLPWMACVTKTLIADRNVRKYFGLTPQPYIVTYDPSGLYKTTQLGGNKKITTKILGTADNKSITFHKIPDISTAEHELVHIYYRKRINSLRDKPYSAETFSDYLLYTLVTETLANAFEPKAGDTDMAEITKEETLRIGNFDEIPDEYQSAVKIILYNHLSAYWLGKKSSLINFTDIRRLSRIKKELKDKKKEIAYNIGNIMGKLIFTDWHVKPILTTSLDFTTTDITDRINIETTLIEPAKRKELLNNLFWVDYVYAGKNLLKVYNEYINPLINQGYQELSDKVLSMKS